MVIWASTRHAGETDEEYEARIAKWLERQPGESDAEYAARIRAFHRRKVDEEAHNEATRRLEGETDEEYGALFSDGDGTLEESVLEFTPAAGVKTRLCVRSICRVHG
jgi:hypothetical protein